MTVLAPDSRRVIPIIRAQTVGAGEAARLVSKILRDVAMHQSARPADWRPLVLTEIEEVARECASEDWDAHGAPAISERTRANAGRFIFTLPAGLPQPSAGPTPRGHIALTWDFGPGRVLTISIGEANSVAYAGILGNGVRRHGVEPFRDDVAKILVESIREVARTS